LLGSVKGKTTRHLMENIDITRTKVPRDLLEKYGDMTLAIDIMTINKIPIMISTSRNIHFGTAKLIHNKINRHL